MGIDSKIYQKIINESFVVEATPKNITISAGDVDGIDATDLRRDFPIGLKWTEVGTNKIDRNAYSLPFFSDEALRYYLPAFLIRAIVNADVYQFIVFALTPVDNPKKDLTNKFDILTPRQANCVLMLLYDAESEKAYRFTDEVKNFWLKKANKKSWSSRGAKGGN